MKAYKGFDKNMQCRGFQFEEGKSYETEKAKLCESGFHACELPLDCMNYYAPNESVYHEVDLGGVTGEKDKDTKVCGTKIKIGARLNIAQMVKAEIEILKEKVKPTTGSYAHSATTGYCAHSATTGFYAHSATTGYCAHSATTGFYAHSATTGDYAHSATTGYGAHSATTGSYAYSATTGSYAHSATTGDYAHSATTGDCAHSATTGDYAHSATTGSYAHSATTGYGAHAATTGYGAHAEANGGNSVAVSIGRDSVAKAAVGNWIVLAEYDVNYKLLRVKTAMIDGETYKQGVWYKLVNGEIVEA